ncbi:MAG: type I-F CRISPR-associated endoribonuclease Cas6/Csy4 [Spirochaetia bacterium]
MNYYHEITLIPGVDIGLYFLWEKIYNRLHLKLVDFQDEKGIVPFGVSFPGYKCEPISLGNKLRLFSNDEESLSKLEVRKIISMFSDYAHLTSIRPIPKTVADYVCFQRVQGKTNKERLARRKAKREKISLKEALKKLEGFSEDEIELPHIYMQSKSTSSRFPLYIKRVTKERNDLQEFNTYGLSKNSTVPVF